MKYIRTKDTIFKVVEETDIIYKVVAKSKKNTYSKSKCQTEVIKQANTIEELCDSEVIVWNDSTPSTWNKFLTKQEFERLYSSFQRKKIIAVYGAIWTDKGLIYVAKMNDKGELELL